MMSQTLQNKEEYPRKRKTIEEELQCIHENPEEEEEGMEKYPTMTFKFRGKKQELQGRESVELSQLAFDDRWKPLNFNTLDNRSFFAKVLEKLKKICCCCCCKKRDTTVQGRIMNLNQNKFDSGKTYFPRYCFKINKNF